VPREVILFAALRQRWGKPSIAIELPPKADAATLKAQIKVLAPQLAAWVDTCRVAQAHTFLDEHELIAQEGELALIPPVSGGIDLDDPRDDRGQFSRLTAKPLNVADVLARVAHEGAGGINIFIGNVRNHSRGQSVTHLEYEAYAPMALKAMDAIAQTICEQMSGVRLAIEHRIGRLEIGESAVIIVACAPHRAEAFEACRRAIEDLKRDVPIWKKEFATNGESWIGQGP
jgi:molybdopterin synthase catalytic subunit